ncbi:putative GPN-loop GTPase, P-loop containing nucleoside triphosphate hydrolase [Helianthus annuus]|nr:putative GPN-loop GTPase, P-loop containing nucleoside triphosphate hydrolase [Helianthus annuus]
MNIITQKLFCFVGKAICVVNVIERRADEHDYVLVDTPGQIEIFTWSASGAIITEAFASTFPTVIAYVVDTPRSESPNTFMSNMLYACSILYKTRLPMVLVFNKTDVIQHQFALEERLEEERRKENMEELRKDMEKSGGGTVVLSTGLKGNDKGNTSKMEEDEEIEMLKSDDDDEGAIDEDEDIANFRL